MSTEVPPGASTAASDAGEGGGAGATKPLSLVALTALVVGSMIGGGIFSLPHQMAGAAAPGPLLIGWLITGLGMFMLAQCYQRLAIARPDIDGGVYGYARAAFGDYVGYASSWGYWMSAWIGNVGYMVLLMSSVGVFIPAFEGGNTAVAIISASVLLWLMHFLVLRGVHEAAFINAIITVAKLVPLAVFIVLAFTAFKMGVFASDIWGTETTIDGESLGSTLGQVKNMMLVTVWVFIGVEGASLYSQRARKRSDVGKATMMGFVIVLVLLLLVNFLSYGIVEQAKLAGFSDPSMAGVLREVVGSWGANFVSLGIIISVLGALLAWVLMCAEVLRLPAQEGVMPRWIGVENRHGAPTGALWLTNGMVQLMLIWTYFNGRTYTALIVLASSLILLPYLFSALYQLILSVKGEAGLRASDVVIGVLATVYGVWLLYAGGLQYLLVGALVYFVGTAMYVWARVESRKRVFTTAEVVLCAVFAIGAVIAVAGLVQGWIEV
ncbi:MAG: arginine-ornithine antiporter [Actinomycetaceae bacterium]|nr:arginine-ornithine antiporter [Actinomycetaceae bacterium]